MDEIVKDFLIESAENLDRLDQDLVKLEVDPSSKELLASIFRTIHTIKGSCGFLGFARLEKLAHAGESLLSKLRDGELILTAEITSALLSMVDGVRRMLGQIQATEKDGDDDHAALIGHLTQLQTGSHAPANQNLTSSPASAKSDIPVPAPTAECNDSAEKPDPAKIGGVLIEQGKIRPEDLASALEIQELGRRKIGEILIAQGALRPEDVAAAQQAVQQRNPDSPVETIRVGVNLLDRLMNLVGELVLARNQLLQFSNSTQDTAFQAVSQRMNLIATELQEEVMKTRMQPIGNVWNKFPRTVRDLALTCSKEVRLEMEGQDTELDRTIIEAIKDPLTHLVRNCIDHGIELPETRKQAGKEAAGVLKLRAFHEGGQVNIEIIDDGVGLNEEKIRQKAIERGLASPQQAARMSDQEVFNMIFLPGFSTAEKVTKVSGRGVGMDVVKTNVEKIGGTVDVHSIKGKGTTVRMKIPLTLAIIPALIVTTASDRYAVPQVNLLELVRLEGEQARAGLEQVNGAPVYRLRGRLLPLMYLKQELKADVRKDRPSDEQASDPDRNVNTVNIVILRADDRQFGLVVDEINDTEEIVVKPLGKQLKSINAYAGATIMGDGRVALILDVLGLAQRANVVSGIRDQLFAENDPLVTIAAAQQGGRNAFLLFQYGETGRMAVELGLVARLEEFPRNLIEVAGDHEVVQYRGQIMPLIRVSEKFESSLRKRLETAQDSLHVVVYSDKGRSVGLVVDRILDIVEEGFVMQRQTGREGIMGSAVIQKRTTDILDVPALVAAAKITQMLDQA